MASTNEETATQEPVTTTHIKCNACEYEVGNFPGNQENCPSCSLPLNAMQTASIDLSVFGVTGSFDAYLGSCTIGPAKDGVELKIQLHVDTLGHPEQVAANLAMMAGQKVEVVITGKAKQLTLWGLE